MTKVVDTPYFVDSRYTIGIQLADIVAGVTRQYHEARPSLGSVSSGFNSILQNHRKQDAAPNLA